MSDVGAGGARKAQAEMTIAPLFHSETPRRAGRPRGARGAVLSQVRALGVHHFAFLRATLIGVDARSAFERYLAWSDTNTDLRHIENRRAELLKAILEAGRKLDLSRAPDQRLTAQLDALRASAAAPLAPTLPTLDVWMAGEGMDPDAWSEADAIAEYKAAHGIDNLEAQDASADRADPARDRVAALNHLQTLLAVAPAATDSVDAWFAPPVVVRLRNVGILTLANLADFVNVHGFRWHQRIDGFGVRRAGRVVAWLRSQFDALELVVRDSVDEPKSATALRQGTDPGRLVLAPRFALLPLEHLQLPAALAGTDGVFRSHMANTLEAGTDLQAIQAWLRRYDEKPSTARSYRKEVERFVLWCTTVNRKPVSSASALDCQAYRIFLQAVPASWIHAEPVARTDPNWRPFRGQPGAASQKQALVIVQTMLQGLQDAGYLVANPMRAVMKGFDLPKSKVNIKRSFTEAEWAHALRVLQALPAGPEQRRLKCLLGLLVSSGIRLDELERSTWDDLRREALPELPDLGDTWVLSVIGKRSKQRDVPIADAVIDLLLAHAADFIKRDRVGDAGRALAGALAGSFSEAPSPALARPLIRALGASVERWVRGPAGHVVKASVTEQGGGALSASGIYGVLKRFFARAARTAGAAGLDAERFKRASTHWMRHTFVRNALVDGVPIEVVSELVGHASIDTTSVYSSQELARKIRAMQGMRHRVG